MLTAWRAKWRARITRRTVGRLIFGLAIGALGGFVAQYFHVPLAWMLGPLFFCAAAAIAGLPAEVPIWLRSNFMLPIGLFLGESFNGLSIEALMRWPVSMAGAVLYLPLATAAAYAYYRHMVRQTEVTALCSSVPGGLNAIVAISGSLGADERHVALAQSLRIAIVVCMAPWVAFGLLGYATPDPDAETHVALISLGDLALLAGASVALMVALRNSGIPILGMICPLAVSAVLRPLGLVEGVLPHWLVEIALLVLGGSVGGRFAGTEIRTLIRVGTIGLIGTAILMAVAAVLAWGVWMITGQPLIALLLAYAPGGVAEMSIIAIAIDADPAFVAVHHVVRIIAVMIVVPLMIARFGSREGPT